MIFLKAWFLVNVWSSVPKIMSLTLLHYSFSCHGHYQWLWYVIITISQTWLNTALSVQYISSSKALNQSIQPTYLSQPSTQFAFSFLQVSRNLFLSKNASLNPWPIIQISLVHSPSNILTFSLFVNIVLAKISNPSPNFHLVPALSECV